MEKKIKIFNSFKEQEEDNIKFWQNTAPAEKLRILEEIRYMAYKVLLPNLDSLRVERVLKIRNLHDPEED